MGLTKDNILVLYRQDDEDSLSFAQYYQNTKELDDSQLLGLPCSGAEILPDYATFQSEIEDPIKNYFTYHDNMEYVGALEIKSFLVGYNVPGGFYDGGDVVATTSRLSRIDWDYDHNVLNPFYDRKSSKSLDDFDYHQIKVASRVDAPTLALAKLMIDRSEGALKQGTANGTFYIDPFLPQWTWADQTYVDDVVNFADITLPNLGLAVYTTVPLDPYVDSILPFVKNDSFVWSSGTDRASPSFFKETGSVRVFFYNADASGAFSIRDGGSSTWPYLAISAGYCFCASAMSDPTGDGYLRPRPFFEAIISGASMAEAFLFASPSLDNGVCLFGDPLLYVKLPTPYTINERLTPPQSYDFVTDHLSRASGFLYAMETISNQIVDIVVGSNDIDMSVDLLLPCNALMSDYAGAHVADIVPAAVESFRLVAPKVSEASKAANTKAVEIFLAAKGYSVGSLFNDVLLTSGIALSSLYVRPSGSWRHDNVIETFSYEKMKNFHFEMDVAADELFSQILISKDSLSSTEGWYFQKEVDVFESLPSAGVSSNYAGRHVRYQSLDNEALTTGAIYYLRIRQKDDETHAYTYSKLVIYS